MRSLMRPYPDHRIQGRHGILENHGYLVAPDRAYLRAAGLYQHGKSVSVGVVAPECPVCPADNGVDRPDGTGCFGEFRTIGDYVFFIRNGHVQSVKASGLQKCAERLRLCFKQVVGISRKLSVNGRRVAVTKCPAEQTAAQRLRIHSLSPFYGPSTHPARQSLPQPLRTGRPAVRYMGRVAHG